MAGKRVKVTHETATDRNTDFQDTATRRHMTRREFVEKIERGKYPAYHVRVVHGLKTPVSNPDKSSGNNLG